MLASIKGIDADLIGRLVAFVAMGLAGVGGMLVGLNSSIDPLTGFRVILPVFAGAVVGGLGSVPGAVVGALVVGVGEELSLLVWDPTYRSAFGFLAILLVLTFRPRGDERDSRIGLLAAPGSDGSGLLLPSPVRLWGPTAFFSASVDADALSSVTTIWRPPRRSRARGRVRASS